MKQAFTNGQKIVFPHAPMQIINKFNHRVTVVDRTVYHSFEDFQKNAREFDSLQASGDYYLELLQAKYAGWENADKATV